MNVFELIGKLYTEKNSDWIETLNDSEIAPVIILKFISMNPRLLDIADWLNKYTFTLPPRMFLYLAWSVVPKQPKAPFVKFLKAKEDEENPIHEILKDKLQLYGTDWKSSKKYILKEFEDNKIKWMKELGVEKKLWKEQGLDFELIKSGGIKRGNSGLAMFGFK